MTGTMRVYRGYTPPRGVEYKVGEVVDLDLNPLSSWSTSRAEAGDFGSHVLQMDVPLHDVAGMGGTGLGGGSMEEVVVFARRGQKARVVEVNH